MLNISVSYYYYYRAFAISLLPPSHGKTFNLSIFNSAFHFNSWNILLLPKFLSFLKINLFILLIYFWLCWVFVAAHGLSLVAVSGGCSSLRCTGFSLRWLLLLWSTGSKHMGSRHAGFSSCGTRA